MDTGQDQSVTTEWRKSSWSVFNGNCVEFAEFGGGLIGVRDTKHNGQGPVLVFHARHWRRFIRAVKKSGHDDSQRKSEPDRTITKSDLDLAT